MSKKNIPNPQKESKSAESNPQKDDAENFVVEEMNVRDTNTGKTTKVRVHHKKPDPAQAAYEVLQRENVHLYSCVENVLYTTENMGTTLALIHEGLMNTESSTESERAARARSWEDIIMLVAEHQVQVINSIRQDIGEVITDADTTPININGLKLIRPQEVPA